MKDFKNFINEALDKNDFLNYVMLHTNINIKKQIKLGEGSFGIVYELNNNKVIKFLVDPYGSEIYNSIKQRDLKLDNVVTIYKVGKIKNTNKKWYSDFYKILPGYFDNKDIFFIIEEKLNTKSKLNTSLNRIDAKYNYDDYYNFIYSVFTQAYSDVYGLYDTEEEETLLNNLDDFESKLTKQELVIYDEIVNIYQDCANNQIILTDDNINNFAVSKNKQIKIFDLMDILNYDLEIYEYDDSELDYIL